ncbi:MAG TPA: PAS domain S-box protein [Acidobacteriaceae bacterium]|jgi:PAS domain S-box-containing protein|nr:PAS domain S-box protein [Acidobacteriaceae bacterium]
MESLRRINAASGVSAGEKGRLLGPAFAHTSVGLAIADREGHFVEANSAFLDIVGRTFQELQGETVRSITHPDDWAETARETGLLYAGEAPDIQMEKRYVRPDGTTVWVRNSLSPLRDESGEPVYTIAISENIDSRKRAEQATAEARETLELATRAADLGVWDLNPLTEELRWSPRCREIFGVAMDAPLRMEDFLDRVHPEDRPRIVELVERVLDPQIRASYSADYRVIHPSGEERWASSTGMAYFEPVPGSRGEERAVRFLGTVADITERRRGVEALVQAEKLAATGRLAASIAHEINNPLEAVTNLLFLLRDATDATERMSYVSLAEQEIRRVTEIATQTLRFYRDPSGPTVCDVAALIESVLTLFHGRAHVLMVGAETRLCDDCTVFGSQGELRQVFVNLVGNALDAMPRGGRLLVRTRVYRGDRPGVRATVADSGQGMTEETKKRLFRPFFTTKASTGTGLGLWLSLEILVKHGASIRVRSRPGRGTVVSVFFPERAPGEESS